ncbi:MAG TPA: hypothetical protein VKG25_27215 [Bryobacteraceae bacterium]|nr:hypothetical protein [Bryobacteraceae bacterium]
MSQPLFAFDSPLSDEAVRDAYFLGQRHDGSYAGIMAKYTIELPPPDTGPQISAVTFFTPFALLVQSASQRLNYSAQQAALEHRKQKETVEIIVIIRFTPSYPAVIRKPTGSRSDSPDGFTPRAYDFWKDFAVQTLVNNKEKFPLSSSGDADIVCGEDGGGCNFIGATLHLEFLASAFPSDSATILITPPEGGATSVDFDLTAIR